MTNQAPPAILLAFANPHPTGYEPLERLIDEARDLRAILQPAARAGRCEVVEIPNATLQEVLDAFQDPHLRGRIALFHFAGHAAADRLLLDERTGAPLEADAGGVAAFLARQPGLQCVFLNACSTAGQVTALHAAGAPAVVATTLDVPDVWARALAVRFYKGLVGGSTLADALAEAEAALHSQYGGNQPGEVWPWRLHLRSAADGGWRLPAAGAPPAARPQPAAALPLQKPRRIEHFTGRGDELARLLADLQPGAAVTLCGPGGMGKTSLAVEALWRLAPGGEPPADFPGGVVFHSFYHQPQAQAALEAIARAYGIDPRPDARAAAQGALAGKVALLVLDGAEEADDLGAVLQVAGGCGVLITTRRHGDAPGDWREIEPLPRPESLQLLAAWAGPYAAGDPQREAAANEIVRLLGGLPLALFLAGRYMGGRRQYAPDYAAWLKTQGLEALHFGQRPSRSVPLLLAASLRQVSAAAQAAFGVAGLLAFAPFDAATVGAGLAIDEAAGHRALGELVEYGLLLRPDARYAVTHALAHSYARTAAAAGGDRVARLAAHYAALAAAESRRGPAGFAVLDAERGHLVAVQAAALAAEQWAAVQEIASKAEDYLDLKGYSSDRLAVVQAGLDAARAAADRYNEGAFLTSLGLACAALGETRRAVELYEQQLVIVREIGDRRGEGNALGNLGAAYAALGETRRAVEYHEQCWVVMREIGDRRGEGAALGNLGLAYAALGETRRAVELYEQQLVIVREIGDRRGEGNALGNLGLAYKNLGETRRAVELYEQQLVIVREIGDRRGEGNALGNLGAAYAALGETRRAVELYEQALVIDREIGDRRGEGADLGNLGAAYAALGETRRAVELYEQALVIDREIGDRRGEGAALGNLGAAYAALGETRRAVELYEQALVTDREIGDRRGEGADLGNLGAAYYSLGETPRAVELYEQQLVIVREIGDRRGEGAALGNLGLAYAALGETRRAVELYEQRIVIAREIGDRRGEGIASWNLGLAYEQQGDLAGAAARMQVMVDYEQEIGHPDAVEDAQRVAAIRARLG